MNDFAQSFTTGTNASGYLLESISFDFVAGGSRTHDPVYVYLQKHGGNGRPGAHLATLTRNGINYLGPVFGVNKYTIWETYGCCPRAAPVHLDANTTYWVYIWAGEQATTAHVAQAGVAETGTAGWSIADTVLSKPAGSAHSNYTSSFPVLKLKVEGTTNPEVTVSVSDATATEGTDATADFVVNLSHATSGPVQVSYETFELSVSSAADEGSDYEATSGTLTFRPGETRKTVSVPILDDARNEGNETFNLGLTNLQGATEFDNNTGIGTIINADPLTVSISDATATEGVDETIEFTVSLNRATVRPIAVNVVFSAGTANADDFHSVGSQAVVFQPNETEQTVSLGIRDDSENEPSETFTVSLQTYDPNFRFAFGPAATGTILNTETLTASFENVPQDHDGSTAFTFNVAFTTNVSIGYAAMRDHAFTVTNGDVTGASRVDGRSDRWLITIGPDGGDAVMVTLPGNRACGTQGAICSKEEHPVQLSNSPSATVATAPEGEPLRAQQGDVEPARRWSCSCRCPPSAGPGSGGPLRATLRRPAAGAPHRAAGTAAKFASAFSCQSSRPSRPPPGRSSPGCRSDSRGPAPRAIGSRS